MNNILCPYPGLRHFEEDEAIFFKGREQHIKGIFNQLQKKNFVMLTGASGDGKSSVVYSPYQIRICERTLQPMGICDYQTRRQTAAESQLRTEQYLQVGFTHVVRRIIAGIFFIGRYLLQ
jgi:ABC-type phosphate/phosphonate transport system ATPase subunit